ncbi:MAG: helix-turn-helix domain-containing protein [Firmicutes bacterium]|nr:helix-turn-helix domain-containing protein [Bacillota bacterium]
MKGNFGKTIKTLRKEKGIRQADLGKVLNVANNTVSSWERGNSEPSLEQLKIIAKYFEVSTDYILDIED